MIVWPVAAMATASLNSDMVSVRIVRELALEAQVIVCCSDEGVETRARAVLERNGVRTGGVRFVRYPCEIQFPRDFGAEVTVDEQGNRRRVDFRFTMYGQFSEEEEISKRLRAFAAFHAAEIGVSDVVAADLVGEGGDREFNGRGAMMAIRETEVDKRNPDKTVEQVEAEFRRVFGVEKIIWIPRASYDDEYAYSGPIPSENGAFTAFRASSANGHIDEICRFADPRTVIVARIDTEEASRSALHALNKERLDQAYEAVRAASDVSGAPFRILEMPVPEPFYVDLRPGDDAFLLWDEKEYGKPALTDGSPFPEPPVRVLPAMSYCNFLVCNGVVLAHKYFAPGMPSMVREKDEKALEVLREAFPGRRVVQIDPLALNLYGGGIHCHTRNVPARTMKRDSAS